MGGELLVLVVGVGGVSVIVMVWVAVVCTCVGFRIIAGVDVCVAVSVVPSSSSCVICSSGKRSGDGERDIGYVGVRCPQGRSSSSSDVASSILSRASISMMSDILNFLGGGKGRRS